MYDHYPNDYSPSEQAAKERLAKTAAAFDPDLWPAGDPVETDMAEDGTIRMAIRVAGHGVLVLRGVPEPTTGKIEFKGMSSFTNAEVGIWE